MAQESSLSLLSFDIIKVIFDRPADFFGGNLEVDINHIPEINKDDRNKFNAVFIVNVSCKDSTFNLQVQAFGSFLINGDVEKAIYESYISVNAPAIVYPYIRAFISNMSIQTGIRPIIIPPLNFSKNPVLLNEENPKMN